MANMVKRISSDVNYSRPHVDGSIVKDLQDGDIVLVSQQNLPRGHWPLGRILTTYPSKMAITVWQKYNEEIYNLIWTSKKLGREKQTIKFS